MRGNKQLFVVVASYASAEDAQLDYEALRELHREKLVGTYDAAVIRKDREGKVHVRKHEKPTQHGAWTGVAVGAVIGILFPPSLIGSAAVLGVAGGLMGHLWHGMSRADMKDLGELIDEGESALVVVGEDKVEEYVARTITRANKQLAREVRGDADTFEKELEAAANAS